MAWTIYTPEKRTRVKQARAQIIVSGRNMSLVFNQLFCRELGFNSLTKHVVIRHDPERNAMGLSFHQKPQNTSLRMGRRNLLDGSVSRTINVSKFLYDIIPTKLKNGTYNLSYSREKEILVLDLNSLTKTDARED